MRKKTNVPTKERIAETIKLALETSWPFDSGSKISVEMLTCSGGLPKEVAEKEGYSLGSWPIATATIKNYLTSHAVSIKSLERIRDKVLRLTSFEFQWFTFGNGKQLELEFANYSEVKR